MQSIEEDVQKIIDNLKEKITKKKKIFNLEKKKNNEIDNKIVSNFYSKVFIF